MGRISTEVDVAVLNVENAGKWNDFVTALCVNIFLLRTAGLLSEKNVIIFIKYSVVTLTTFTMLSHEQITHS